MIVDAKGERVSVIFEKLKILFYMYLKTTSNIIWSLKCYDFVANV